MTSIAEKYAAQWMPNGEVSLVELIQAAIDEAVESRRHEVAMHAVQQIKAEIGQSVPVVGEPVGFVLIHEDGGKNLTFHDNTGELSDGWSQHKLVIQPTTYIHAAELASLREKAAMVDELRKDAERYRWLRMKGAHSDAVDKVHMFGPQLDTAIDAAIAQEGE